MKGKIEMEVAASSPGTSRKKILATALLAVVVTCAASLAGETWQGAASIGVEVKDKAGKPVAGARVTVALTRLRPAAGPAPLLTDREGRAAFSGLAEGEWLVSVAHPEFMVFNAYADARAGKAAKNTFAAQMATATSSTPMRVEFYKTRGPAGVAVSAPGPAPQAAPTPPPVTVPPLPGTTTPTPPPAVVERAPAPAAPTRAPSPTPPAVAPPYPPAVSGPSSLPGKPVPKQPPPVVERAPAPPPPSAAPRPTPPAVAPTQPPAVSGPSSLPGNAAPTQPPAVVETRSTPAPPVPAPPIAPHPQALHSSGLGNCPECHPGEWALVAEETAPAGAAGCGPGDRSSAANSLAALGGSVALAGGYGPLSSATPGLAAPVNGSCRLLVIVLPPGAKFVGYRYEAEDDTGGGDCVMGQGCKLANCGWTDHAAIVRGTSATIIYGLFENRDSAQPRRGRLTAYFRPALGWSPN